VVDDVITTGATAEACGRALKRAGAARVDVLALARAVEPTPSCCSLAQSTLAAQLSLEIFPRRPSMTRILLYTTPFCGYCRAAKQLLHGKALDFEEIDVAFDDEKRAEMIDRAMGLRTVPQIFIHGRHVGGHDELAMLEREGKLDAWLAAAPRALADAEET
jgi:glutaredoxin 3